nr:MAG TPA: hypothetical protein [Caudoviricetes sp.]
MQKNRERFAKMRNKRRRQALRMQGRLPLF